MIYVKAPTARSARENRVSLLEITLESAMFQIDPQVKAAECERVIRVVSDPECRSVLMSLRGLWVALGNEEALFDRTRRAGQVPKIAQIHAELMCLYKNAMH